MYQMSGIGRYLQLLMPVVLPLLDTPLIEILGNPDLLRSQAWALDPRVKIIPHHAHIFSIPEQVAALSSSIRNAAVLWSPQYNIPLFHQGKLIVTIHDLCQIAHPETLGNKLQRWYSKLLITQAVSRAEAVLCVSKFTASEVRRILQADPSRITVAYPQLDDRVTPAASLPPPSETRYFLAVGNVKKHKNLATLISAFRSVKHLIPHELVIVGKQEGFLNSDSDLTRGDDLLSSRVKFTGFVSEDALCSYYRNAEALIFPSFYEGFGFPLVEAMAQGCPVACSNASSLPEVANGAALLFEPFDVAGIASILLEVANNNILRKSLVQRGFLRLSALKSQSGARITASTINRVLRQCP